MTESANKDFLNVRVFCLLCLKTKTINVLTQICFNRLKKTVENTMFLIIFQNSLLALNAFETAVF